MRYAIGKIAEIIDGDRGKNYPQQHEFFDKGYCLFLNTGNVTANGFSFVANQFISKEKCDLLRKGKLKRRDIVYTTRGTVGNAAFYSDTVPYEHIRINSGMVILRPNEELVCTEYLYQILKSEYFRPFFKSFCTGSAQPQLPIKNFSTIELDFPDLPTQKRIASMLSAYTYRALQRLKNYAENNADIPADTAELEDILLGSEGLFETKFRNCMMHYGLDNQGVLSEEFVEKPFYGMIETCFNGMDFESYREKLHTFSESIITYLESKFDSNSLELEEL